MLERPSESSRTRHALTLLSALALPPAMADAQPPQPPEPLAKNAQKLPPRPVVVNPWEGADLPKAPPIARAVTNETLATQASPDARATSVQPAFEESQGGFLDALRFKSPRDAAEKTGYALGVLAIAAAIRGVWKGTYELLKWRGRNRDSALGNRRAFPSLTEHIIDEVEGKFVFFPRHHKSKSVEALFELSGFARAFLEAAQRCTPRSPFPAAHFKDFLSLPSAGSRMPFSRPDWTKHWWPSEPDLPRMMHAYHCAIRQFGSDELNAPGASTRAIDGKLTEYFKMIIIPIAENKEGWSTVVFAAIHEKRFRQFGDPKFVTRLKRDCPDPGNHARIDQLVLAYEMQQTYEFPFKSLDAEDAKLFPSLIVMSKIPRKNRRNRAEDPPVASANGDALVLPAHQGAAAIREEAK